MSRLFTFLKSSPFPLPSILKPKSLFKNSPRASNSSPTPTPSPIPPFLKEFTYWSLIIASWIPASIFFQDHIAELHIINGASMYPFLNTGYNESLTRDVCLVDKRRKGRDLERGMLVSFRSPYHPETLAIKRIIALPGDRVYTHAPYPYPYADIPAGHVWVEGDNADSRKTLDSNHYGPIAINLITGKLTHVLWPWGVGEELGGNSGRGGRG
ncbi:mitochondrial inner membrane protease subunit [Botrytis cinerea]